MIRKFFGVALMIMFSSFLIFFGFKLSAGVIMNDVQIVTEVDRLNGQKIAGSFHLANAGEDLSYVTDETFDNELVTSDENLVCTADSNMVPGFGDETPNLVLWGRSEFDEDDNYGVYQSDERKFCDYAAADFLNPVLIGMFFPEKGLRDIYVGEKYS